MSVRKGLFAIACAAIALGAGLSARSWTTDPGGNTAFIAKTGTQRGPVVRADHAGGGYVHLYDAITGFGNLTLNRFDANGALQWGPDGIVLQALVHNLTIALDFQVDASDNAIVGMIDTRF